MTLPFRSQMMSLILLVLLCAVRLNTISCCHERDRSLLLKFKEGVVDPSNRLSAWSTLHPDCCKWENVECDQNNRVETLDLLNYNLDGIESFRGEINLSSLLSLPFLKWLLLESNDFERISIPYINNSVVTHQTHLLPNSSSKLHSLDLSDNIHLHIPDFHWLSRLPSLTILDLSGIHLSAQTNIVQSLASLPLEHLHLHDCNLTTSSILSPQYANFSSLTSLDLGLNDFSYGLPNWLFNLSKDLYRLNLNQCNLRGEIPDFSAYRNLWFLNLSNNKLEGSIPDWLGQLDNLTDLNLSNNSFHSSIPSNLLNASSLRYLNISFNDLSEADPIILEHEYYVLDLSHNSIGGDISKLLLVNGFTYLSYNKFKGQLPRISDGVIVLDLAQNSFFGSLSSLLCRNESKFNRLAYLDISNNFLTGELPNHCWRKWANLSYIYLGSNKLFGEINPTMGSSLPKLMSLDLQDNSFYGHIPRTFKNCTSLVLLNLEGNKFSGSVPKWMPQSVSILKLRSNQFTGHIPTQLCSLSNLILLDLANNTISGPIPFCLHNLTFMVIPGPTSFSLNDILPKIVGATTPYTYRSIVHAKGQELAYDKNLKLVRSIDLSVNELSGEIPAQLFKLTKLQSLNLSYNYFRGEISGHIGEMKDLESLDFSHNSLHGNIPQSMSGLSFLSFLNLSYNHFSGQIPLGTQLQSFDAWSYIGNPKLCGAPLPKNCTIPKKPDNTEQVAGNDDDDVFLKSLYLGMGVGFAVGFWIICGSLFLNRAWRHAYFRFFDGVVDRIYIIVAIKLRRFH